MAFENSSALGELRGDINMTPMIDILLVLLIIFMVITPVVPHGLEAALPQRSSNPSRAVPIVVQIISDSDGDLTYKINQDPVPIDELPGRLSSMFSSQASEVMFIKADANLDFSTVARIMDIAKGAGAAHIGLLTSRDPL